MRASALFGTFKGKSVALLFSLPVTPSRIDFSDTGQKDTRLTAPALISHPILAAVEALN